MSPIGEVIEIIHNNNNNNDDNNNNTAHDDNSMSDYDSDSDSDSAIPSYRGGLGGGREAL